MSNLFLHRVQVRTISRGLTLGLLLIGGIALAQFSEPIGAPDSSTNAMVPLDDSDTDQIKVAGDLAADFFTATNQFCIGASCISDWWAALDQPTTCKLEVKRVREIYTSYDFPYTGAQCEDLLYTGARSAGWVSTSFDNCHNLNGSKCNNLNAASCTYTRLVCTGGVTLTTASTSMYTTYPVTGAMTGDPYAYFVRTPQCMDGINNGGSAAIDFPNDPNCTDYSDDSELVL